MNKIKDKQCLSTWYTQWYCIKMTHPFTLCQHDTANDIVSTWHTQWHCINMTSFRHFVSRPVWPETPIIYFVSTWHIQWHCIKMSHPVTLYQHDTHSDNVSTWHTQLHCISMTYTFINIIHTVTLFINICHHDTFYEFFTLYPLKTQRIKMILWAHT